MKKLFPAFVFIALASPAFAQVAIVNQPPNAVANGVGSAFDSRFSNNIPTTSPTMPIQGGIQIKSLDERRQERIMKQNQRLQESGVNVQQIPMQQQGVMNIQPENVQNMGQQYQGNGNMPGLQPNGAPAYNGTMQ